MAQLLHQMTYLFQDLVSCFNAHFSDVEKERSLLISFNLSNVNVIQIHTFQNDEDPQYNNFFTPFFEQVPNCCFQGR